MLLGSCFSTEIGQRLYNDKLQVTINPHGILFQPLSIFRSVEECLYGKIYHQDELIKNGELYHSLAHHGSFSSTSASRTIKNINKEIHDAHASFSEISHIIITFGSAHYYRYLPNGEVAGNCHKFPSRDFEKNILSRMEICAAAKVCIEKVRRLFPEIKFIFTVSPVKYLRDGLVENNLSKSVLITACHQIIQENENCFYFPSYEIMNDELRDYRFYKEDLAHPNEIATDYIYEKFVNWGLTEEEAELRNVLLQFLKSFNHRVLHPATKENLYLQKENLRKLDALLREFPFIKLQNEREQLKQRIKLLEG